MGSTSSTEHAISADRLSLLVEILRMVTSTKPSGANAVVQVITSVCDFARCALFQHGPSTSSSASGTHWPFLLLHRIRHILGYMLFGSSCLAAPKKVETRSFHTPLVASSHCMRHVDAGYIQNGPHIPRKPFSFCAILRIWWAVRCFPKHPERTKRPDYAGRSLSLWTRFHLL